MTTTITEQIRAELINTFKIVLMDEDTECGNEVLCTSIAEKCADAAMFYIDEYIHTISALKELNKTLNDVINDI